MLLFSKKERETRKRENWCMGVTGKSQIYREGTNTVGTAFMLSAEKAEKQDGIAAETF